MKGLDSKYVGLTMKSLLQRMKSLSELEQSHAKK
jgi:hypothetical protein